MKKETKEKKPKKSPLDFFFSLGDKVTKTPEQKANWDYAFLWIIFCAFGSVLIGNLYNFFFVAQSFTYLGWSLVMVGILWFQYHGLKQAHGMRKMMKEMKTKSEVPMKIESVEDMVKEFKNAK